MVQVVVGNNVKRETTIVENTKKLVEVLDDAGIEYSTGAVHLNGVSLQPGDFNKSFAEFGITDGKAFLLRVTKADNA